MGATGTSRPPRCRHRLPPVCDVVVVSVGVVAAALAADQPLHVGRVLAALRLPVRRRRGLRVLGAGLAPALDPVHHHHLAGAVRPQVLHEVALALSLEVARLAVEGLLLLGALRRGGGGADGDPLRCFGGGGRGGAGLSVTGQVLSFDPPHLLLLLAISYIHADDVWTGRLGELEDAHLSLHPTVFSSIISFSSAALPSPPPPLSAAATFASITS
ncbi:hypothetical protein EYF80_015851 [Liparis tanakae]|uniref:Uncharacterized protein n=1 Tax=Liparis tanakae TaxID=230148 RepID=A0A4Z2I8Z0_9TELE|nr:hypothetical protein EYF80_015851 [Liparis tanakae]